MAKHSKIMDLRAFKLALETAPLTTVFDAQARYTIKEKQIILEWTGTTSGKAFTGIITEESLKVGKRLAVNCFAVCMAKIKDGILTYEDKLVPVNFFNKLEFPL